MGKTRYQLMPMDKSLHNFAGIYKWEKVNFWQQQTNTTETTTISLSIMSRPIGESNDLGDKKLLLHHLAALRKIIVDKVAEI